MTRWLKLGLVNQKGARSWKYYPWGVQRDTGPKLILGGDFPNKVKIFNKKFENSIE